MFTLKNLFPSLGSYCPTQKSCECNDVPDVNTTMLQDDISYYGVNDTAVNKSITAVTSFSAQSIELLCKRESF